MPATSRRAVFLCYYYEPLRSTILPLCRRLAARGRLVPHVLLQRDDDGRMAAMCHEAGVSCEPVGRSRRSGTGAAGTAEGEEPRPAPVDLGGRDQPLGSGVRWLTKALEQIISVRVKIAVQRRRLQRLSAAVLIVLDDRLVSSCCWVRAAERAGIPVAAVQWAATHRPETLAKLRAAQLPARPPGGMVSRFESWLARRVPGAVRQAAGRRVWWMPAPTTLALWLWRAHPRANPWSYGGGNAQRVTVLGESWRRRFLEAGVPAEKLAVTGHPPQDDWYTLAHNWRPADTAAVARQLDLPGECRIVTVIAPSLGFRRPGGCRAGELTVEDIREDLLSVIQAIEKLGPPYVPVVKVHPRDDLPDFEFVHARAGRRVRVVREIPVERLIAASAAMACQFSTTAVLGNALGVPVLIFDFRQTPSSDLWRGASGLLHARDPGEFTARLAACLGDARVRQRLRAQQQQFVGQYLCCDGQATDRIVALIEDQDLAEAAAPVAGRAA